MLFLTCGCAKQGVMPYYIKKQPRFAPDFRYPIGVLLSSVLLLPCAVRQRIEESLKSLLIRLNLFSEPSKHGSSLDVIGAMNSSIINLFTRAGHQC